MVNFINVSWPNGNEVIAPVFELSKNNGCPTDNQVAISGCPSTFLVARTWSKVNGVEFHSWSMKIDGCPSDNTSVFLVVR